MSLQEAARLVVMVALVPLWIAAGLADWACHRRTAIERTSGVSENLLHWLLLAEGGLALVTVALLEVNAAVLLVVFACFLAHELTTYIELRYTVRRREVRPVEQMVHSFMEILPLCLLALLSVMAWDQVLALFDADTPDLELRPKDDPWPPAYLAAVAIAVGLFNLLPLTEEALRCWRARRSGACRLG